MKKTTQIKITNLVKYYALSGVIYLLEILILYLLSHLTPNIYLLNLLLRILFEGIKVKGLFRMNIFVANKSFFVRYFLLCIFSPIASTSIMFFINEYLIYQIFLSKFLADILVSLFAFMSLSYQSKK